MAYIWSYLRRYPKWLAMNFTAAILFVIANLVCRRFLPE